MGEDWQPRLGHFFKFPVVSGAQVSATWVIRGSDEYVGYTKPSVRRIPGGRWSCSSAVGSLGSPALLSDSFLRNLQMMFDVTFSGGLPTGPVIRITALYDAGSDMLTCYIRDLRHFDPSHGSWPFYPRTHCSRHRSPPSCSRHGSPVACQRSRNGLWRISVSNRQPETRHAWPTSL